MHDQKNSGSCIFYMKKDKKTALFSEFPLDKRLQAELAAKGFTQATPIQHQVIPGAITGKDVIGIAQTGTGKTLGFGIPMIQQLLHQKGGQGLILVPTRELANQVDESLRKISSRIGIRTAVVMGGVSKHRQIQALKKRPHIIIATPGRLVDLMNEGHCRLDRISIVTLDEADRMLDVGFLPQIRRVLKTIPKKRQTMLFSATMPKAISSLATEFMQVPLRIEIAPQGTSAKNVEQEIFVVRKPDKMRLLDSLLEEYKENTILVFSRTKHGAKRMARQIRNMGHTATEIHGNRSQAQRKAALDGFTKGKFRIMVATDIAARGIDVKDISLVINYDLPDNSEDYVHRIGRTGRAGRYGKAISFVTPSEKADVRKIERLIRKSLPVLALPTLPPARQPAQPQQRRQGQPRQQPRGEKQQQFQQTRRRGRNNGNKSESQKRRERRRRQYRRNSR